MPKLVKFSGGDFEITKKMIMMMAGSWEGIAERKAFSHCCQFWMKPQ